MGLEPKDNSFENTTAIMQADSRQPMSAQGKTASDEMASRALAEKHGVEFIKLSETELSSQVVRLLPQRQDSWRIIPAILSKVTATMPMGMLWVLTLLLC